MINIGIEKNQGLVYEVDGNRGHPISPTPVITAAKFVFLSEDKIKAEVSDNSFGYRFREDSFDPVSRIRRGRFYVAGSSQSNSCIVSPHPARPMESIAPDIHAHSKLLDVYYGNPIFYKYIENRIELPLVLLGVDNRYTSWVITDVEAISTGEDLVTLKARSSFGILPKIIKNKIPENFYPKLNETLDRFLDEARKSSPVSVIDRARDVATHALLAKFNLQGRFAKDLGELVKGLEAEKLIVAANAANIIARFHARAKPSEQERGDLRPIREQDAELAIQCVGSLLCEIGFAEWS